MEDWAHADSRDALIGLLSAVGPLPHGLLTSICGPDLVREHERSGRIELVDDAHTAVDLIGQPVELSATDRQAIALHLVQALETTPLPAISPAVAHRLAELLRSTDTYQRSIVLHGARAAHLGGLTDSAGALCQFGLRHDPGNVDLLHLRSMALEASGRHGAATSIDVGRIGAQDAAWLGRWASNLFLSTGRIAPRSALALVADDHLELQANLAWIEALDGDVATVAATTNSILDNPNASSQAVVWACVAGALPAALDGRSEIARGLVAHARSILGELSDELSPFAAMQIGLVGVIVDVRTGRLAEAIATCEAEIAHVDSPFFASVWAFFAGIAHREAGSFESGFDHFQIGLGSVDADPFGLVTWGQSEMAVCTAMGRGVTGRGDADLGPDVGQAHGLFRSSIARNRAWIHASGNNSDDAIKALDDAVSIALDLGQHTHAALALLDIARFGEPSRATSMLTQLNPSDAPITHAISQATQALVDRDDGDLRAASRSLAAVGMHLQAAELIHIQRAKAHRAGDLHHVARLELLEGADAPLRSTPLFSEAGTIDRLVTERERAVARLCATGRSSREIAQALGISVRTVDNLLGRTYRKCGFDGRAALRSWLED